MKKKSEKPSYSPAVKIVLIAVLAVLIAALVFVIVLQARQAKLERGELAPAQSTEPQTDAAAEEEAAAAQAAEEQRAEEAERAEAERAKRAEEAKKYSFYQKLAHGCDVKMLIMGDSVISGYGASGEGTMWQNLLKDYVEDKYLSGTDYKGSMTVENLAGAGEGGFKGVLMLDCAYPVVREDAKAIADGMLYTIPKTTAIVDPHRDGRSLITVNKELVLTDSMSVIFTSKDYADKFNGVYLAWEMPKEKTN